MADKQYDRSTQDLGNIVNLGHVNVCITDQHLATHYYVTGLGLTRDPFLNTGARLMWINVGMSQFHLPNGQPDVVTRSPGLAGVPISSGVSAMHSANSFAPGEAVNVPSAPCR